MPLVANAIFMPYALDLKIAYKIPEILFGYGLRMLYFWNFSLADEKYGRICGNSIWYTTRQITFTEYVC